MSLWDYIHKYAPAADKNNPVKYTQDMVDRFNRVIGENVITKDTSLGELKESLSQAGLDPEHTITRAHLQTEDPSVLKALDSQNKTSTNQPAAVTEKKQEPAKAAPRTPVTYNPNPTFTASPYTQPVKQETAKLLNRQEIAKEIEAKYKIKPTEKQLDILANPNIKAVDKAKKLGIIKNNTTSIEDESIIESIGNTISKTYEDVTEVATNTTEQLSNWWSRHNAKTSKESEPIVAKEVIPKNSIKNIPRATGEKIKKDDRKYYTPEVIDLKQNKFGVRNRGDLTPLETEGGVITTFHAFKKANIIKNNKVGKDENFVGVDVNGNLKVGTIKEFNDTDQISKVYCNNVIDFVYNPDGTIKLDKRNVDNPNNPVPVVKIKNDAGKIVEGHINFLTKENVKNPYDQYGSIQGGRVILKTKDKTILVSGSINNLAVEFNKLKKITKEPIQVFSLDNGSYNLGIRTFDNKLTKEDLRSHDNQNKKDAGGNFIYLVGDPLIN